MGLFDRRRKTASGFLSHIQQSKEYSWIADYLNQDGSIRDGDVWLDINRTGEDLEISGYTVKELDALVAALYADYLGVEAPVGSSPDFEDVRTLQILNLLPAGTDVRRVHPKDAGNNWAVQYRKGTIYYGRTLIEAMDKAVARNDKIGGAVNDGLSAGKHE